MADAVHESMMEVWGPQILPQISGAVEEESVGAGIDIHCLLGKTVKAVSEEIQKFHNQK